MILTNSSTFRDQANFSKPNRVLVITVILSLTQSQSSEFAPKKMFWNAWRPYLQQLKAVLRSCRWRVLNQRHSNALF